MKNDTILVLDFGGQYCHLIARRIREYGVYSELVPHDVSPEEIKLLREKFNVKGLILSGGPISVYVPKAKEERLKKRGTGPLSLPLDLDMPQR